MKTVKLTVLFKSGAEKTYLHYDVTDNDIEETRSNLREAVGSNLVGNLGKDNFFIATSEIASVEIEVLE